MCFGKEEGDSKQLWATAAAAPKVPGARGVRCLRDAAPAEWPQGWGVPQDDSWRAFLLLFLPIKATKCMRSCTCGGAGCWLMMGDSSTAWASSAESQNLASCSSWPLFETKSSSPSRSSKAAASLCHEHLRRITVWSHRVTGDLPPRIKVLPATLKKNHIYPLLGLCF